MSALKDGMVEIILDRPRKLLFDLNVIEALNDKYGDYSKLGEILNEKNRHIISDLKFILCLLMNEAAEYQNILAGKEVEKPISEKFLGMIMNGSTLNNAETIEAIYKAFNIGMSGKEPEPAEEDDYPTKAATTE